MRRIFAFSVLALASATLAACSDSGGSTPCGTPPQLAAPQLLYPIPGATGVPDSPQYLVVSAVGPAGGSLYLIPPGGGTGLAAGALGTVPSPAPSPAATPAAGATPLAASIPSLAANTLYSVKFLASSPTACVQGQSSGIIGTFSTQ